MTSESPPPQYQYSPTHPAHASATTPWASSAGEKQGYTATVNTTTDIQQQGVKTEIKVNKVKDDKKDAKPKSKIQDFNPYHNPFSAEDTDADREYQYAHLKPCFPTDIHTPEYQPLQNVVDRGIYGDTGKRNLFAACDKVDDLTVNIGTELSGLQVKSLTGPQKDDLARLVAERGVVVLRDQDLTADELVHFGRYFGAEERPLHRHPTSGVPRAREMNGTTLDDIHTIWHDENMRPTQTLYTSTDLWHSDVSFEHNPPGLTALYNITNPVHGGGDTLFSSSAGLYDALSPAMQDYLKSLSALHSGVEQSQGAAKAGLHLRREAVENVHPLVRTHPVTGWNSIFANPAFTRSIQGVPKTESDAILAMLYATIGNDPNLTLRVRWQAKTLVLWDNRSTVHAATFDHWRPDASCRRHALRVAATAEIPHLDEHRGRSRQEAVWEGNGFDVEALNSRQRKNIANTGFKD